MRTRLRRLWDIESKEKEMWKKDGSVSTERVPGAMAAYRESVDEFSKHAAEFLEHISTLAKAREAYQRAITLSTELRSILDTGDEALKALMAQLEQAISVHLVNATLEKKRPESAKVGPFKTTSEDADVARVLP
jgi:exonuclease VII small subunit